MYCVTFSSGMVLLGAGLLVCEMGENTLKVLVFISVSAA